MGVAPPILHSSTSGLHLLHLTCAATATLLICLVELPAASGQPTSPDPTSPSMLPPRACPQHRLPVARRPRTRDPKQPPSPSPTPVSFKSTGRRTTGSFRPSDQRIHAPCLRLMLFLMKGSLPNRHPFVEFVQNF